MPAITRLACVALIGALLILTGCKGVQPSAYQQEMEEHFGGTHGGGY